MSVNIIHANCEKSAADDKSLPRNAYLVTYVDKDKMTHDIVMADSKVDILILLNLMNQHSLPSPRLFLRTKRTSFFASREARGGGFFSVYTHTLIFNFHLF